MIYLDMDGVIADFFGQWAKQHNVDHWKAIQNKEEEIDELANSTPDRVYDYFYTLPVLPGGEKLVNWLLEKKIDFTILSSPLKGPFRQSSIDAKKDWLDDNFPGLSANAIFEHDKYIYAKDNILIDDFNPNLKLWKEHQGTPVKYEDEYEDPSSYISVIQNLEKILESDKIKS